MKNLTVLSLSMLIMVCLGKPIEINEQNWESLLAKDEWMVEL